MVEPPGGKLLVPKDGPLSGEPSSLYDSPRTWQIEKLDLEGIFLPSPLFSTRKEFQNYNVPGLRLTLPRVQTKPTGIQLKATLPFEYLEVDFHWDEILSPFSLPVGLVMYILVMGGGLSPTWTERTSEVTRSLLREIAPDLDSPPA